MRFLIDNALSPAVAAALRLSGHDAAHIGDYGLHAATDDVVFDRAASEGRILVSADTDFGTLLALRQTKAPSVILFRRTGQRRPSEQVAVLLANLPTIEASLSEGALVVLEQTRIRIRRLPIGEGGPPADSA